MQDKRTDKRLLHVEQLKNMRNRRCVQLLYQGWTETLSSNIRMRVILLPSLIGVTLKKDHMKALITVMYTVGQM